MIAGGGPNTQTPPAAKVEAVGKDVTSFQVGDDVSGFNDIGPRSQAQYLVIAADRVVTTMPKRLSFEDAAARSQQFGAESG